MKFCKKPAFATILQSRERMLNWLVILLETGKSQSGLFTRVAHDMKLMLDFHKGCKLLDFYFKVVVALFHDIIAN